MLFPAASFNHVTLLLSSALCALSWIYSCLLQALVLQGSSSRPGEEAPDPHSSSAQNLLIWRWYIVLACLYFLVLLFALSSLFLSHFQPNNFQTRNVQAAVLHWEFVLGKESHFSRKRPCHRMTCSFASLGKGCQSPEIIMKMSVCMNAEEPGCRSIPCIPHWFSYTFPLCLCPHFHSFSW